MTIANNPVDTPALSAEQLRKYKADGFLFLPKLFTADEVEALRRAADELTSAVGPIIRENPRLQVDRVADGFRIRQVWPLIDISPLFNQLAHEPRVTGVMSCLFDGQTPLLFEDKLNYKYPRGGTAFVMHQDYAYWKEYSPRLVTLLIYLDEATEQNGSLEVVSGMHTRGLVPHHRAQGPTPDLTVDPNTEFGARTLVTGPAGTAVVFSCFTPHMSGPNLSQRPRRALIFTYSPASDGSAYEMRTAHIVTNATNWMKSQQASTDNPLRQRPA